MKQKKGSHGKKTVTSEELRTAFGLKPIRYQTTDKKRLGKQRISFSSHHICPTCKNPMTYIEGTNVYVCTTKGCKGIEKKYVNEDGEEYSTHDVVYHTLEEKYAKIANNLFKD